MTRSLSTFRPTVKGVRFRTMFFCSLPCTNTSAGKTPEVELWLPKVLRAMKWLPEAQSAGFQAGILPTQVTLTLRPLASSAWFH